MRVLVACEYSGRVREAFRKLGHDSWSCDLIPSEDNSKYHIQCDVLDILDDGWDLMIAHPPCTYLASSGLHWNKRVKGRDELTHDAMMFVFNLMGERFIQHNIKMIALENPIGRISTAYRKPDQIIQPWQFGEDASKATCLWLKGLPLLKPTNIVKGKMYCCGSEMLELERGEVCPRCGGLKKPKQIYSNQTPSGQNKLGPSDERWKERSRTYSGIAEAMATQWGKE